MCRKPAERRSYIVGQESMTVVTKCYTADILRGTATAAATPTQYKFAAAMTAHYTQQNNCNQHADLCRSWGSKQVYIVKLPDHRRQERFVVAPAPWWQVRDDLRRPGMTTLHSTTHETRMALGGAYVPPTKVFRRLTGSVNKTRLKALLAAAAIRPMYTSDFPRRKIPCSSAEMISKTAVRFLRTKIQIRLKS